jgi:putative membrane protein
MAVASQVLSGLVAALHLYFLVLEMFLWATPVGQKAFGRTAAEQASTKVLAANQGLYNGFLAAGLVWSLIASPVVALPLRVFFLGCVVIAGVYGGLTASRKILVVQAVPAALALAATLLIR